MKVVAFLGSPRKDGNTELLLKEAVKGVEGSGSALKLFNLNLMKIRPCQNCGGCAETGHCVMDDEMSVLYPEIRNADRIILASPIFFSGLSAQTKILIDRCQCIWCEKYLLKRPIPEGPYGRKGLLLLVGGMKKEKGAECSGESARAFFRTVSVKEHKELRFLGVDAKGDILNHPTALRDAFEAGRELTAGRETPGRYP